MWVVKCRVSASQSCMYAGETAEEATTAAEAATAAAEEAEEAPSPQRRSGRAKKLSPKGKDAAIALAYGALV